MYLKSALISLHVRMESSGSLTDNFTDIFAREKNNGWMTKLLHPKVYKLTLFCIGKFSVRKKVFFTSSGIFSAI